jgi:hypothetical protein
VLHLLALLQLVVVVEVLPPTQAMLVLVVA